jgi:phosphate transport system ATP-binding protein
VTSVRCVVARCDRLSKPGGSLSGGQQERLSIACVIAAQFDVVLMDEHCPALDPLSASGWRSDWRVTGGLPTVIMAHNMQQASWISDRAEFSNLPATDKLGRGVEFDVTERIFSNPMVRAIEDYISGWCG